MTCIDKINDGNNMNGSEDKTFHLPSGIFFAWICIYNFYLITLQKKMSKLN